MPQLCLNLSPSRLLPWTFASAPGITGAGENPVTVRAPGVAAAAAVSAAAISSANGSYAGAATAAAAGLLRRSSTYHIPEPHHEVTTQPMQYE